MSSSDRIYLINTCFYVANPFSRIDFPSLLLKLGGFINRLKNAFRYVKLLCDNAKLFVPRKRILSSNKTDYNGRLHKLPAHFYINLIKPIYYSPANNDHFCSVLNLSATEGSSSTPPLISNVEEDNDADLYKNGWVKFYVLCPCRCLHIEKLRIFFL